VTDATTNPLANYSDKELRAELEARRLRRAGNREPSMLDAMLDSHKDECNLACGKCGDPFLAHLWFGKKEAKKLIEDFREQHRSCSCQ
jgi:hypothetical protein